MFCPACQQDVPALAVPEEPGVVRCAFCGEELEMRVQEWEVKSPKAADSGQETAPAGWQTEDKSLATLTKEPEPVQYRSAPASEKELGEAKETVSDSPHHPSIAVPPPICLEDWELEPQLRAAERLLKGLKQEAPAEQATAVHAPHLQAPDWHVPALPEARFTEAAQERQQQASEKPEKSGFLAWTCLSLGVMAFACGGVLIAWSLLAGRDDLWSVGLPLVVIGQGGLVIGLLLQLDGLWQSSKKTAETLTHLDEKLHDLSHTTTMLGTTRSTPAQSFYVHMAEGASPHLLLADLKGQLDLLAERMARK